MAALLAKLAQRNVTVLIAEVPLAELFGYSTDLRSQTQGQGTFIMEFAKYRKVPASIQVAEMYFVSG